MFRYDAAKVCELLGVPNTATAPMPEVPLSEGEVLLWFPGITLTEIRNSPLGKERLWQNSTWYDDLGYTAAPGYYAVNLRVPDSANKTWSEQLQIRPDGTAVSPVAVAALALAIHLQVTCNDLSLNDWCRCAEAAVPGFRTTLTVYGGRVCDDYYWDGSCDRHLWLAASRKF